MNTRLRSRRLIEQSESAREIVIGVGGNQARDAVNRAARNDRAGPGGLEFRPVFGIREEGYVAWARVFEPQYAGNLHRVVGRSFNRATESACQVLQLHGQASKIPDRSRFSEP